MLYRIAKKTTPLNGLNDNGVVCLEKSGTTRCTAC
jgi:hypothetical protein